VYRHQPLPFHQQAMPAAEASMEAFEQRGDAGFWAMHDLLFENQQALGRASLERYAAQIGLDLPRFSRALDEHPHSARIRADSDLGNRIGANGTPAFYINGVEFMGAQAFEAFAGVIERERDHARRLVAAGVPRARVYDRVTEHGRTRAEAPPPVAAAAPRRLPDPHAVYRVPIDGAPVLGPDDALVTVVVFSDFQCPFCSRVEPTLARLRTEYGRDLRIVWMNNPLPFHQNAEPAAEAAMEVFTQTGARGFWAFHDLLFENQQHLERADLERYAATIRGVHMRHFRAALDGHSHRAAIEANQALARSLGASGTPSFFINGRNLRGAQPIEAFRTLIDEVRAEAQARVASGTPRARVYAETIANGAVAPVFLPSEDEAAPAAAAPPPSAARAPAAPPRPLPAPPTPPDVAAPPPSATRTATGLATRVLAPGSGTQRPGPHDRVVVHYAGWTTDGRSFDESYTRGEPPTFPVDGVIAGFAEALQLMVVGERRRVWIPESLAYGGRAGAPAGMLVFDIELVRIEP
jgi:protein-disulfide isomerase